MEERAVIRLNGFNVHPDYEKRYFDWHQSVYNPLLASIPGIVKGETCCIIGEKPEYPKYLTIWHYPNKSSVLQVRNDQRYLDIGKDYQTLWPNRIQYIWQIGYEEIMYLKRGQTSLGGESKSENDKSTLIALEGDTPSSSMQSKYEVWFNTLGREVFIPLLLKTTGLKEYTKYRLINIPSTGLVSIITPEQSEEYPAYLSILTFDNIKTFENYENSPELAAFKRALLLEFPVGIFSRWHVQYHLLQKYGK